MSAGLLRLSSFGPSSALGEKGKKKKKKKKNGVKQEKFCEPPHQSSRLFLHCWAWLQLDMPMTAFCPFTEYTFYDIFRESGLASFTFFSGKTRHCCVHRWPIDGGEIQTWLIQDWLFLRQVYRVTAPLNGRDCFAVIDDQRLRARW